MVNEMKREEIERIFDEMIDSIPKIKIKTFISYVERNKTKKSFNDLNYNIK